MTKSTSAICELPELLTGDEVLKAVRLTKIDPGQALYRLRKSGRLPGIRIGKSYKYKREDVARLLSGGSA